MDENLILGMFTTRILAQRAKCLYTQHVGDPDADVQVIGRHLHKLGPKEQLGAHVVVVRREDQEWTTVHRTLCDASSAIARQEGDDSDSDDPFSKGCGIWSVTVVHVDALCTVGYDALKVFPPEVLGPESFPVCCANAVQYAVAQSDQLLFLCASICVRTRVQRVLQEAARLPVYDDKSVPLAPPLMDALFRAAQHLQRNGELAEANKLIGVLGVLTHATERFCEYYRRVAAAARRLAKEADVAWPSDEGLYPFTTL